MPAADATQALPVAADRMSLELIRTKVLFVVHYSLMMVYPPNVIYICDGTGRAVGRETFTCNSGGTLGCAKGIPSGKLPGVPRSACMQKTIKKFGLFLISIYFCGILTQSGCENIIIKT